MGGRVAEELTQDDITTGAGNDIERATEMARRMVCEWGMSKLGPLASAARTSRSSSAATSPSAPPTARTPPSASTARSSASSPERYERGASPHRAPRRPRPLALELLEQESLDGASVYAIIEEMTGRSLPRPKEPARPKPDSGGVAAPEAADEGERVPSLGLEPGVATA